MGQSVLQQTLIVFANSVRAHGTSVCMPGVIYHHSAQNRALLATGTKVKYQ